MNQNDEFVEAIYRLGLELFPYNAYIALFAADFYLNAKKALVAQEVIHNTLKALKDVEGVDSETYDELNKRLSEIEQLTRNS